MTDDLKTKYEPIIGLEVHIQLLTKSKAYCSDSTEFGAMPNTQVSPVSLGHPGTLPMVNKKVIEYAIKLGVACKCTITKENQYARKNYFYPDLPKGYQISQQSTPICTGGFLTIPIRVLSEAEMHVSTTLNVRKNKKVLLTRIHMEEDTGKSIHDQDPDYSLIDLNRAGVPLLEMVTEPVIANADEAYSFVTELRRLVRYLEICDGNMEEGSMRCDANISVRLKGDTKFGTKVEVKNMNSISNVKTAIEYEIERQIESIEKGVKIVQETRNFDAATGTTASMRTKESSDDYRYFPEPDLPPVMVTEKDVEGVKNMLPPLPDELYARYTTEYKLNDYDVSVLIDNKEFALYFEELSKLTTNHKASANWMMGDVKSYLNENAVTIHEFPLKPSHIAGIISLIDSGKINNTIATQKVFPALLADPSKTAEDIAKEQNLVQESDTGVLEAMIKEAISKYPDKVTEYKNGKAGLLGLFMGEVMKLSKGKADPKKASELLKKALGICLMVLMLSSCTQLSKKNTSFELNGKLSQAGEGVLVHLDRLLPDTVEHIDSTTIDKDGKFSFHTKGIYKGFYTVRISEQDYAALILDSAENVELEGNAQNLGYTYTVNGSPDSKLFWEFNMRSKMNMMSRDSLQKLADHYMSIIGNNKTRMDSLNNAIEGPYDSLVVQQDRYIRAFIRNHINSFASIAAIQQLQPDKDIDYFISLDSALNKLYPTSVYVKLFHSKTASMSKVAVGSLAPEITLPDTNGNMVSLSSLRGKYVLIDFWASWCEPCKESLPGLVKIYAKYKDNNFSVFSVSLDKFKENWTTAIRKYNLSWTQVSDLKYWNSKVVPLYNFSELPFTILISPEGRIIAKKLSGSELDAKLYELTQRTKS